MLAVNWWLTDWVKEEDRATVQALCDQCNDELEALGWSQTFHEDGDEHVTCMRCGRRNDE